MIVDSDAPGLEKQHIPTALRAPDKQWQLFFDDVEVPAERLIGSETGGLKAAFDGLNPERIMGAAVCNGAGAAGARPRRATTRASGSSGARRSARTRASRIRSRRPRSSSSWRG